jgi:hypothetical protein
MANDATKVRVAASGTVNYAPTGTALPTDTTTALNVAFLHVGYISDDGIGADPNESTSDVRAWGGDLVRRVVSEYGEEYTLTMIETNANSIGAYFGNGTASAWQGQSIQIRKAWVFHILDGATVRRVVLPDAEVTDRGAITYATTSAISYPITISTYPNAAGVHSFHYAA